MQTEKQRERLIELIKKSRREWLSKEYDNETEKSVDEYVADYLMSNNVVVFPMKLGQTCFAAYSRMGYIDECRVSSLTQKADGSFKIRLTNLRGKWVFEITEDEIGKKVFLSRAEAENALKERKENGK